MGIIEDLEFKGIWRSYQQRVLDELDKHLDDKKLNVVAAPGAGKTTLGIEVMSRLGHNALILAPTITIRNQWKQRILDGFLPDDYDKTKISTDIRNITNITVSTYQALHTIYKMPEEKEKFLTALKKNKIKTLVLDESHHLRTEWYLTLDKLCEYLDSPDFTTVSLTGTPPYDVSPEEWNNYHTLCGPVDAEISIPELVKNGDLCPHQDLIYFSDLSSEEEKTVYDFEKNRSEFFRYIERQSDFQHAVEMSKFVQEHNPDVIFKNTGFTLSVISYLLSADSLNIPAKVMTEFLELETNMIPSFDLDMAKTLVDGILGAFEPYFENSHVIKNKLKELKLLNGNKADLKGEVDFKKLFARSVNKLDAIRDITTQEYSTLKKNLREVVLLDYIGKGDTIGLNIFSVFDKLVDKKIPLGILTGTLIVIPETAKEELYKILERRKIASDKVLTTTFKDNYLRVETYGEANIVSVITELFEKGKINVLIGTAALLGEGWDSPSVNTLIIASVVGSFMLSNQMRGRALRIDKNNPEKSSNIWHLVSLTSYEGVESPDFQTVIKRFNTFEGISYKDNQIQNGISRLGKTFKEFEAEDCKKLNAKMFEYAKGRENLKNKWEQVFKKSKINEKNMTSQMYEIIETDTHLPEIIENEGFMRKFMSDYRNRQKVEYSKFEQMKLAQCILKTLCDIDVIKTPFEDMTIQTDKNDDGKFSLTLVGGTSNERNIFVKSFCEVFAFDDATRYILKITRKVKEKVKELEKETDWFDTYIEKTVEKDVVKYLPVPNIIGTQQKYVKIFTKNLKGEKVEKERTKNQNIQKYDSCFEYADENRIINIYYIGNTLQKRLRLEEFIDMIRYNLSEFNKKGILKKNYTDIDIMAYKDKKYNQLLLTFFSCSDYERNLIINNLCEMYLQNSLILRGQKEKTEKVKGKDGITYIKLPQNVFISHKYEYEIKSYIKSVWMPDLSYRNKQEGILPVSRVVAGIFSGIPSIFLFIIITESVGINFPALVFSAVVFFFIYIITIAPINGINKLFLRCMDNSSKPRKTNGILPASRILASAVCSIPIAGLFYFWIACGETIASSIYFSIIAFIFFYLFSIDRINKFYKRIRNRVPKIKNPNEKKFLDIKVKNPNASLLDKEISMDINLPDRIKDMPMSKKLISNGLVFSTCLPVLLTLLANRIDFAISIIIVGFLGAILKLYFDNFINKFDFSNKNLNLSAPFNIKNNLKKLIEDIQYKIDYIQYNLKNDLSKNAQIDMLYTKSAKNRGEVLKARYNAWLNADISRSRKWI